MTRGESPKLKIFKNGHMYENFGKICSLCSNINLFSSKHWMGPYKLSLMDVLLNYNIVLFILIIKWIQYINCFCN